MTVVVTRTVVFAVAVEWTVVETVAVAVAVAVEVAVAVAVASEFSTKEFQLVFPKVRVCLL